MRSRNVIVLLLLVPALLWAQGTYYQYQADDVRLVFFDKNLSRFIPHMIRMYQNGTALHGQIWTTDSVYRPEAPLLMVTDWEDEGNGGASPLPHSNIFIGMSPLSGAYHIAPAVERYRHLFTHEYTHSVMTDKYNRRDLGWRKFLGAKVTVDNAHPLSAMWSYMTVPRWYAPRWYHEGIACFMETWLNGGVGRALGGYDEMNFRSIISRSQTDSSHFSPHSSLYSVVGLETEGSTMDFQVGANAYLYGTRFVNFLVKEYGYDKLIRFYNRTADSRTFWGRQFREVYGKSLRKIWDEWKEDERQHQVENLDSVRQYPLTVTTPVTEESLGSVSPLVYDPATGKAYAAMNAPGDFAHITEIDLVTGRRHKLVKLNGAQLYNPAFVTLDRKGQRLIFTSNNAKMRGLEIYDLQKRKVVKHKKFQRKGDLVYDNTHDCLYAIYTNGGTQSVVRLDRELENPEVIYAFHFGVSVFDMDVSHDGRYISLTRSGANGEHTLLLLNLEELEQAVFKPVELLTWDDANLGQFRFSLDDRYLIGSSYYTGVSNLWQINLETRETELLSNTDIGLFAPLEISPDELLALQFERDGMRPVKLQRQVLHDANAITLYGQKAYENNRKALESVGQHKVLLPKEDFGDVYNAIKPYKPLKEMRLEGTYPTLTGFTDKESWNNMTLVLGYRFFVTDPVGLSTIKLGVGLSPWSHNSWKNRFHADLEWKYYFWTLKASWNHNCFYDLVGPRRESRKGYMVGLSYDYSNTEVYPYKRSWGFSLATYGDMDALPLYQEITVDNIKSMQTASLYGRLSKLRTSLGGVMPEQGYNVGLEGYCYLADGSFYPSLEASADIGMLLPFDRNHSLWLRTAGGHNFGDSKTAFGNTYFGGFRNNYLDYRDAYQYRTPLAMPGSPIDAIPAHSFAKATAEYNFRPIRYNNFGFLACYPTWTQCSLFGTALATWNSPSQPSSLNSKLYYSAGIQLTTEIVFFSYMKTTLSLGYGHLFAPKGFPEGRHGNEFMVSLKLF